LAEAQAESKAREAETKARAALREAQLLTESMTASNADSILEKAVERERARLRKEDAERALEEKEALGKRRRRRDGERVRDGLLGSQRDRVESMSVLGSSRLRFDDMDLNGDGVIDRVEFEEATRRREEEEVERERERAEGSDEVTELAEGIMSKLGKKYNHQDLRLEKPTRPRGMDILNYQRKQLILKQNFRHLFEAAAELRRRHRVQVQLEFRLLESARHSAYYSKNSSVVLTGRYERILALSHYHYQSLESRLLTWTSWSKRKIEVMSISLALTLALTLTLTLALSLP